MQVNKFTCPEVTALTAIMAITGLQVLQYIRPTVYLSLYYLSRVQKQKILKVHSQVVFSVAI